VAAIGTTRAQQLIAAAAEVGMTPAELGEISGRGEDWLEMMSHTDERRCEQEIERRRRRAATRTTGGTILEQQLTADAARAIRDLFDSAATADPQRLEQEARRRVRLAMLVDGITPARIAAAAGVRQLLVARLVENHTRRIEALIAAKHDAERYHAQVMDDIRHEAIRLWQEATGDGEHEPPRGTKSGIAEKLQITRVTLDDWLATYEQTGC
jgi:hypothetical protein